MRIGIVDVDTSHPQNWIPLERELGHEVVALWDGGAVHEHAYVKDFAARHAIPRLAGSLEELADAVDCAVIHGCDWDTHVDKARPFVERGKAVLVDKPVAGNLRDLRQFRAWAEAGVRVTGGSSLRFCVETREFLARPVEERGIPHTAMCGCGVDEFNYGIHAYALLVGLMGGGIRSVTHLGKGPQRRVRVDWTDGRMGFLVIGAAAKWQPFHASVVTEAGCHQFVVESGKLYRALLTAALPYLAGETEVPPLSPAELIEPELAALAALRSWQEGDREVRLDELALTDRGYDGSAFARGYRAARK